MTAAAETTAVAGATQPADTSVATGRAKAASLAYGHPCSPSEEGSLEDPTSTQPLAGSCTQSHLLISGLCTFSLDCG